MVVQHVELVYSFEISCELKCGWKKTMLTSSEIKKESRGRKTFDINTTTVVAFREIGRGHSAMETFCGYMNMPRPMAVTTYNDIVKNIRGVNMETAAESMQYTAEEIREENLGDEFSEDAIVNVSISMVLGNGVGILH